MKTIIPIGFSLLLMVFFCSCEIEFSTDMGTDDSDEEGRISSPLEAVNEYSANVLAKSVIARFNVLSESLNEDESQSVSISSEYQFSGEGGDYMFTYSGYQGESLIEGFNRFKISQGSLYRTGNCVSFDDFEICLLDRNVNYTDQGCNIVDGSYYMLNGSLELSENTGNYNGFLEINGYRYNIR